MRTIFIPLILIWSLAQFVSPQSATITDVDYTTVSGTQGLNGLKASGDNTLQCHGKGTLLGDDRETGKFEHSTEVEGPKIMDEDTQFVYPDKAKESDKIKLMVVVGVLALLGLLIVFAYIGYKLNEKRQRKNEMAANLIPDKYLLDYNDDVLLAIIDRLGFDNRARFCGASRRLAALEAAATAVADEQSRVDYGMLVFRVREAEQSEGVGGGTGWVGELKLFSVGHGTRWRPQLAWTAPNPPTWSTLRETTRRELPTPDKEQQLWLFARAIKCCTFEKVYVHHTKVDPKLLKDTFHALRGIRTNIFELRIGLPDMEVEHYDGVDPLVPIDSLLWVLEQGGVRDLHLIRARAWATERQVLYLIKMMREADIAFDFFALDMATAAKFALQEMGIAPHIFENPTEDLDEIRTSKKDAVVYFGCKVQDELTFILKESKGFIVLHRHDPEMDEDNVGCTLKYNWNPEDPWHYTDSELLNECPHRVPFEE